MQEAKTVLIAEDSSVIQTLTKRILEQQNYRILVAKNGTQVLDIIEKEVPNLILLDITMPVMDGMQCARSIRKHPDEARRNIPIVVITGNLHNYSDNDFKEAGITGYMLKPVDFDMLVEVVDRQLNNKK